ncbi:unnamed protein product, partial [Prorocentrum cordatum]
MARLSAVGGAVAFLVALLPLSRASSGSTPASGVQKVIKMLTNMKTKGQQEMNDEQVAYSKFKTWCSEESASLGKQVAQNGLDCGGGCASPKGGEMGGGPTEVSQLGADITRFQAEMKKETAQREIDHKNFLDEQQDYSESVDALDRAIATLRAQDRPREGSHPAVQRLEREGAHPGQGEVHRLCLSRHDHRRQGGRWRKPEPGGLSGPRGQRVRIAAASAWRRQGRSA